MHKPSRHRRSAGKALLIDLDNLVIDADGYVAAEQARTLLRRVLAAAGAVDYILAVAPRATIERYGATLADLGIRWQICDRGPDAADRVICLLACDLVELGYDHMLIASGDHYFTCIAGIATLTIVLPAEQRISWRLTKCAFRLAA